ncbi:TonB-dependent receptor, partial [mine drainage metagenome]
VTNLETVKVTARRYEETLQDVPIAVTALTARALTDNNVQNLADLQGLVPNLQIGPTQGTTSTLTVYLRGIGQNNPLWGFDPEVGLYLDGVYIARPQSALLDVFDVDRIEVLRGPQGTLYGKNTVGGAINFISKPLPTHATGSVTATLGMHATTDLKVDYGNASKNGVWRFRVAAVTLHHGGYGHDLLTGSPNSNQNVTAARVSLGYFPEQHVQCPGRAGWILGSFQSGRRAAPGDHSLRSRAYPAAIQSLEYAERPAAGEPEQQRRWRADAALDAHGQLGIQIHHRISQFQQQHEHRRRHLAGVDRRQQPGLPQPPVQPGTAGAV